MRAYLNRERSDLRLATSAGVLGQSSPTAGVLTSIYTVAADGSKFIEVAANRAGTADTFRIAVSPRGAAVKDADYVAYDHPIEANDSLSTAMFEAGPGDMVRVYSTNGNMSFLVNGTEE